MGNTQKQGSSNLSVWGKAKHELRKFIFIIKLMRLKRKANKMTAETGQQYLIIKAQGVPTLMSRTQIVWWRQHGLIPRNVTFEHIKKAALHVTSTKKQK